MEFLQLLQKIKLKIKLLYQILYSHIKIEYKNIKRVCMGAYLCHTSKPHIYVLFVGVNILPSLSFIASSETRLFSWATWREIQVEQELLYLKNLVIYWLLVSRPLANIAWMFKKILMQMGCKLASFICCFFIIS